MFRSLKVRPIDHVGSFPLRSEILMIMWVFFSTVLLAFAPSYAAASEATCRSGFSWMYNSEGESPCYIASALFGVCDPYPGPLSPLQPPYYYYTPPGIRDDCNCNTVFYSLVSACAVCQGGDTMTWSQYQAYCPRTFVQAYPSPLPAGVGVPHYAYLDVTTINNFDPSAAQGAGGTESVRPSATTTTQGLASTSPIQTSGKRLNGGIIAGGVVGGVVVLGILIGVVVWLLRRRRASSPTLASQASNFAPQSPAQMSYTNSLKPSVQQQSYNSFPNTHSGNQSPTSFQLSSSPQQPFHPGSPEL